MTMRRMLAVLLVVTCGVAFAPPPAHAGGHGAAAGVARRPAHSPPAPGPPARFLGPAAPLLCPAGSCSPDLCGASPGAADGLPVSARAVRTPGRRHRDCIPVGVDFESDEFPAATRRPARPTGRIPVVAEPALRHRPSAS